MAGHNTLTSLQHSQTEWTREERQARFSKMAEPLEMPAFTDRIPELAAVRAIWMLDNYL